jgi:hypothetical protein
LDGVITNNGITGQNKAGPHYDKGGVHERWLIVG